MNPSPWKTCSGTPAQMHPRNPTKFSVTVKQSPSTLCSSTGSTTTLLATWSPWNHSLTPKPTLSTPPTSDATGQSSQFLGVLYLALTGLIDSALPVAGPWAVAGKALSYLLKLGPIIWWAMPVPALTPPSPTGAPRYSWYPDAQPVPTICKQIEEWNN
ncbi:hypothetical protein DSO57_1004478 [Entomophthora muscae]|uniref:Uncharacterized protein n=1 Tax=Entomophthora muscae TaxID=34485 RepID=A0ACC2UTR5_9FUNG|nr:hypothetical protein DSO57_1004478 [Entomophthora muscae]